MVIQKKSINTNDVNLDHTRVHNWGDNLLVLSFIEMRKWTNDNGNPFVDLTPITAQLIRD
jgi:hypothetical protein